MSDSTPVKPKMLESLHASLRKDFWDDGVYKWGKLGQILTQCLKCTTKQNTTQIGGYHMLRLTELVSFTFRPDPRSSDLHDNPCSVQKFPCCSEIMETAVHAYLIWSCPIASIFHSPLGFHDFFFIMHYFFFPRSSIIFVVSLLSVYISGLIILLLI